MNLNTFRSCTPPSRAWPIPNLTRVTGRPDAKPIKRGAPSNRSHVQIRPTTSAPNQDAFHAQNTRKVRLSRCRCCLDGPAASKSSALGSNDSPADKSLPFLDRTPTRRGGIRRARCLIWYLSHFSQASSNAFRSLVRANVGIGV